MDSIIGFFDALTLLTIVKWLIILLLGVYLVFAGLMARQISSMIKAVTMKDDFIIRILGLVHFVFAVIVFLAAIFIL